MGEKLIRKILGIPLSNPLTLPIRQNIDIFVLKIKN